ncbi:GTPase IMAP family member 4-like, partial [Clupea harengus]|uniref:GTPase IMAP family member 4-like n=1 Tax=Clupea harengus TaxID=7950 RepID=A0A8M1K9V1_CLUHA
PHYKTENITTCIFPVLLPWRKATDDELMKKINQLENMTSEVEKTKQELENKNKLLQERETELDNMTKREKDREGLEDKNKEVEKTKQQLEDKNTEMIQIFLTSGEETVGMGIIQTIVCVAVGGESPGPAPPVSPAVSELRLVLLGGSTAGKRAAGNTILGTEEFGRPASTHTLTHTSTETQHSESRQGEVAGRRVTVVETPDWFCSGLSEKDLRQDVGLCVRLSTPGPHAFLLVIPEEPSEGEERRMLEKMEDMFGEGCWGHTLILFTHAEGMRERSVEELLQTGSQELQQLVEKCGNRCHLLNVKDRPDDTKITQLLEKIEEMVSGNRERFYSSQTYQEAEKQLREIERRIQKEREVEERKLMEERERRKELDKNVQESLKMMEGEIQQHEGEIRILNERTTELEKNMKEERDEEKKREMERELKREITQKEEMERKLIRVREKRERERKEMEERHREEMEEMRESYEREARTEAERNLMKIILPELQRNISITKEKMKGEFNRQMEEKNRRMEEKNREIEGLVDTVQKLSRLVEEADEQRSLQS